MVSERPKVRTVWVQMHVSVLEALDAVVAKRQRSRVLEALAREYVLKQRRGGELPVEIQAVLALID